MRIWGPMNFLRNYHFFWPSDQIKQKFKLGLILTDYMLTLLVSQDSKRLLKSLDFETYEDIVYVSRADRCPVAEVIDRDVGIFEGEQ
jgi:hypothetical protein